MTQEALFEFEEVSGKHAYFGNKAFSSDGNCQHVLAYSLKVHNKDHIVSLREAGHEFNSNLSFTVLLKATSIIGDVELVLEASAISRDSHHIVDLNVRGIGKVHGLLDWELVRHATKVNDLFGEFEGWRHNVPLKG